MSKQIIINHSKHEIRVALIEDSVISEIFYEREKNKGVVGNIYKGRVLKVLPGMESAFVDIGLEKAAFLFVDDIRTDQAQPDVEDAIDGKKDQKTGFDTHAHKKPHQNISDLIKEGQDLMVQVSKGPIGTKGARITCGITLPGRNLVFMPQVNNVGVSRQIKDEKERNRLRRIVSTLKTEGSGFIVRTVATGRSEEEFKLDIEYLMNTWEEAERKFKTYRSPAILHEDLNLTTRTIRDMLSKEVSALIIDDENEFDKIKKYLNNYLPVYNSTIQLFKGKTPIFDYYGISLEIARALSRKVWLKSKGYLVIDQSEALTAIDVNTGSFIGSNNHEETILTTNMESAVEIVHQLKLRDIGGIIIIDFIDMESEENRHKVYNILKKELRKDKARTKALAISEIGLVEMTRKRNRENIGRFLCKPCPYCEGTSRVKSSATTIYDLFREVQKIAKEINTPKNLLVGLHPDVADYLEMEEFDTFKAMEKVIKGSISLQVSGNYHYEQFEIFEV